VELYFERLEKAGLGRIKRPDLLIFRKAEESAVKGIVASLGGIQELPFASEEDTSLKEVLSRAFLGIECENSLWQVRRMPDYGSELKPQRRLDGRRGLKKSAVVPTVILKGEDQTPLRRWEAARQIRLHLWHVFYDQAYGIAFDTASKLIRQGLIEPKTQVYQAPGGSTTEKTIYKIYYHYAYRLGESQEEPSLVADHLVDKNGHILPYVKFAGGRLKLSAEALRVLDAASEKHR